MLTESDRQIRFWHCYKMELKQAAPQPLPCMCVCSKRKLTPITCWHRYTHEGSSITTHIRSGFKRQRRTGVFKSLDRETETLPRVSVTHFHILHSLFSEWERSNWLILNPMEHLNLREKNCTVSRFQVRTDVSKTQICSECILSLLKWIRPWILKESLISDLPAVT